VQLAAYTARKPVYPQATCQVNKSANSQKKPKSRATTKSWETRIRAERYLARLGGLIAMIVIGGFVIWHQGARALGAHVVDQPSSMISKLLRNRTAIS